MDFPPSAHPSSDPRPAPDALAAGRARLPAFASLCSRALAILGRQAPDRLAGASPTQKQWHESASLTLAEMSRRGARMPAFVFLALDERGAQSRAQALLATRSFVAEREMRGNWPSGSSAACGMTFFTDSGQIIAQVGSSRQTTASSSFIETLAEKVGGMELARAVVVAHEWAHCWQHAQGLPFGRLAAEEASRQGAPLAAPALAFIDDFQARKRYRMEEDESLQDDALGQAEEGFCDLVGAWAASRLAQRNLASGLALQRETWPESKGARRYATGAILRACLPESEPLPESFEDLVGRARERLPSIVASSFHLPADPPKLSRPHPGL